MRDSIIEKAARNNAMWCESICALHNTPGTFLDTMWLNKNITPMFYPNVVTLKRMKSHEFSAASNIFNSLSLNHITIKDSFNELFLEAYGFSVLFEAEWVFFDAKLLKCNISTYKKISTEDELVSWENAWNDNDILKQKIFLPEILKNNNAYFFAKYEIDKIVAGFIINRSENVLGLSNVFNNNSYDENYWSEIISVVREEFSDQLIVGYEKNNDLALARKAGFKTAGMLKVWKK